MFKFTGNINYLISILTVLYLAIKFINADISGNHITIPLAAKKGIVGLTQLSEQPKFHSTTTKKSNSFTESSIPLICINGIKLNHTDNETENISNHYDIEEKFVQKIEGDAIISVITKDPTAALFIVNRINQQNIINGDFELGVRIVHITKPTLIENILIQEVEYLQLCVDHPVGIFLDNDFYKSIESAILDLEYNIWAIPKPTDYIFPKVVHLLYEMPWGERTSSVEISTDNLSLYNDFMDAARTEHLCLMHFRSQDNIYILLGNNMVSNFKENGTIFAIPTGRNDKKFINDLPNDSYILMESEVDLKVIDENSTFNTLDESLIGKKFLSSEFLSLAGPLLDISYSLNNSLTKKCEQLNGIIHFETCVDFLSFVADWSVPVNKLTPIEILEKLNIRKISHLMTFEMFQKITVINSIESKNISDTELREIASQNFISNLTTFFHYNQVNETSHELKSRFGKIFNCQYADGTNRKFPFYFEGESVMYWRLKPDVWIIAGLTAAILGILITMAILIFIITRVVLGDVFEGNPASTIALLISLIILFLTFIPFSMEYVSDHRNSKITYEDAQILNTLCAVRVFLITISYCLTFSLLLCRAIMLASIGSEGGFLSHVNGYVQFIICMFSALVQIGLSAELLIFMHIAEHAVSCQHIFNGYSLFGLLTYDFLLLLFVVLLIPFIYRSQRNYREGLLLVVGSILCFIIWCTWIIMCFISTQWREPAISLGIQATGWAVLIGILIPRIFLIVRGIERSDIAQALPSLTSLAFSGNNQFSSEQSVYECVNPAMRISTSREDGMAETTTEDHNYHHRSPNSEMPTLPLRGTGGKRNLFQQLRANNASMRQHNVNQRSSFSDVSSIPRSPSPSKITRF